MTRGLANSCHPARLREEKQRQRSPTSQVGRWRTHIGGGWKRGSHLGSGLHYQLTDQLGTRRVQTDPAGTPETDCRQLPYGDGLNCFAAPGAASTGAAGDDANPLHFTGKQRDTETGNDSFLAR
jgi:hypothetical protein